jgi:hypothetical protein
MLKTNLLLPQLQYLLSIFTSAAKIATAGIKSKGYTSGRELFAFSGPARILRLLQIFSS